MARDNISSVTSVLRGVCLCADNGNSTKRRIIVRASNDAGF